MYCEENTKALLLTSSQVALEVATREKGLAVNADKTSTWSSLEIRMQDIVKI
jgi:hypothetical protein